MKNILVPVDFSSCASNALRNAIVIAERLQMKLLIMHSYIIPVALAEHAPGYITEEIEASEKIAHDQFKKLEAAFPGLEKIDYELIVEGGNLLDNVRALAEAHDLAMIVMGTHGASGLQRALLGTNANSIMKHINCPVIALPEDADLGHLKHIALAGDYKSLPSPNCLKAVIDIARAFFAEVQVIHIDQDKDLEHNEMEIARSLEKYLKHVKHSFHFRTDYDIEEGLLAFAKEHDIELLAMIHKHHGFLDRLMHTSETRKMMLDIPMPLMVLHE